MTTITARKAAIRISSRRQKPSIARFIRGRYLRDQVGHHRAAPFDVALRSHVALEDRREGVLVADVEVAERGDRHVHVERLEPRAEAALGLPARDNAAQQLEALKLTE